jgi:hypothetical protein
MKMKEDQEIENKSMKIGITDEFKRFSKLTLDELYTLKHIYYNRLNQINNEIKRNLSRDNIPKMAEDIMKHCQHCDEIFIKDAELIIDRFNVDTQWTYNNRKVPNDTLALATVSVIYDKYNIEYDPHELINHYDLDDNQYYKLYIKLSDYVNSHYWCK